MIIRLFADCGKVWRPLIRKTTSASYLDLLLSIGRELHISNYDKRYDFNFHITNFPFLRSNIPSSLAYGVFISQHFYDTPGLAPRMNILF